MFEIYQEKKKKTDTEMYKQQVMVLYLHNRLVNGKFETESRMLSESYWRHQENISIIKCG